MEITANFRTRLDHHYGVIFWLNKIKVFNLTWNLQDSTLGMSTIHFGDKKIKIHPIKIQINFFCNKSFKQNLDLLISILRGKANSYDRRHLQYSKIGS